MKGGNERITDYLVGEAPEMVMSLSVLGQFVSWSTPMQRPVTLREYIASRSPQSVRESLNITPLGSTEPVKKADELTDEELQQLTLVRMRQGGNVSLAVGSRSYSNEDLINEVEQSTDLGRRLMDGTRMNGRLIQRLVDTGKMSFADIPTSKGKELTIRLPDFHF